MTGHQQQSAAPPRRDVFRFEGLEYTMITKVAGDLHSGMDTSCWIHIGTDLELRFREHQ